MVVTVLSNILGSGSHVVIPCPYSWARNRLNGIGEEVYPEGTHLMVPFTFNSGVHNPDLKIRFPGLRHPLCMTSEPSPEASPA